MAERCHLTDEMVGGDFTSRLEIAIRSVIKDIKMSPNGVSQNESLTNILFEKEIPNYRDAITLLAGDRNIILLLDDLDKGWPALQVERYDVQTIKHLIDALSKIQRDLSRKDIKFQYLIFIRSDVYENLVAETSDRGKYNVISVDWSDPAQLENIMRQRVIANFDDDEQAINAWNLVNPSLSNGTTAIDQMIKSSLMRPRFLIDLCEKSISFSINRGRNSVIAQDVEDALKQQSLYLVSDFGYEIRDVSGLSEDIFYKFLGQSETLTPEEVKDIINFKVDNLSTDKTIDLLVWYGFLGIPSADGNVAYIYDREYDMRRLDAERQKQGQDLLYVVNPAFLRGLS